MTKIGANIKKIRTTKGLSQQAFADIFGLTRGNISSYEENRAEPRIAVAYNIAKYFGIPFEAFVQQSLTVNQILNFKGDALMTKGAQPRLHVQTAPFIDEHSLLRCLHGELAFTDRTEFPQLSLPYSGPTSLLALAYNSHIPHPGNFPQLHLHDVLIFEEVNENNYHLCHGMLGLYITSDHIMLGNYRKSESTLILSLNELKEAKVDLKAGKKFWRHFATYAHVE